MNPNSLVDHFPMYMHPYQIAAYLARYELYKCILSIEGCIIECGVAWGGGLMWWSNLGYLLEPHNIIRKFYGFDVFNDTDPFPSLSEIDGNGELPKFPTDEVHLQERINQFSEECTGGQIKTYLIKGDACETIPKWIADKPHALVSLLYLDFDVYLPTRTALECFLPRMPRGSIVAFDECHYGKWPGETVALLDTLGVRGFELQRFPWCPMVGFIQL